MPPLFEVPAVAEEQWIADQFAAAETFITNHAPTDGPTPLSAAVLDRAFSAWIALRVGDATEVNNVINAVGIAFGSLLVRDGGFSWVIASDEHGSDLAVLALPGAGDVLVYPANFVAKRWEAKVGVFMEGALAEIIRSTRDVSLAHQRSKTEKRPWWKFGGGRG